MRAWLRVLEARPQFVTVADWNNFEEETAIEDSYAWEDRWGHAVPDLYTRITRAYSRLREADGRQRRRVGAKRTCRVYGGRRW